MKALVIGGDGRLGTELVNQLRGMGVEVVATSRRKGLPFDLTKDNVRDSADVGFIVAANTKLAECEEDRMGSHQVNVDAPIRIARQLKAQNTFPVYFSSEGATWGTSIYGQQKALADTAMQIMGGVAVLRIRKVSSDKIPFVASQAANIGLARVEGVFVL